MKILLTIMFLSIFNNIFSSEGNKVNLIGTLKPGTIMIGEVPNAQKILLDDKEVKFNEKGVFFIGFDRDDKGVKELKIKFKDGSEEIKKLKLKNRKYKIQKINNMKSKYVNPPDSESERIRKEGQLIKEARKIIENTDQLYVKENFYRPVKGGRISSVFGSQRILNGEPKSPHNGVDIALPKGTDVFAMADGKVQLTGDDFYYSGNTILIDHGLGLSSIYIHLNEINVEKGQMVKKGEKIGTVGSTGRSTGPHLHWGVQWYGNRIDPLSILDLNFNWEITK